MKYAIPNLINYMTNGLSVKTVFPYLVALPGNSPANQIPNFNYKLEVLSGIIWVLPFALFSLFPICRFLVLAFRNTISPDRDVAGLIRNGAGSLKTYIPLLLGGLALFGFLPLLSYYGATMRYDEDFTPALILLSIWGFWTILEKYSQRIIVRRGIMILAVFLVAVSLLIASLLGVTSYFNHFKTHNPKLFIQMAGYHSSCKTSDPLYFERDFGKNTLNELICKQNPDKKLEVRVLIIASSAKKGIYAHPPQIFEVKISIPKTPSSLDFSIGINPAIFKEDGDGVGFSVTLSDGRNEYEIFSKYIDPKANPSDRKWFNESISLDNWAGKEVVLKFSTSGGPAENYDSDWAYWGDIRLMTSSDQLMKLVK